MRDVRAHEAPLGFRLRQAQAPDADAMTEVLIAAWHAGFSGVVPTGLEPPVEQAADRLRQRLGDGAIAGTVAEADESVCGFCVFGPSRDPNAGEDIGEIYQLFVTPEVWRSGVGSGLIEQATAQLRRQRNRWVTVWTFAKNARASHFYANRGYRPDGAERHRPQHGDALEIRCRRPFDTAP